MNANNMSSEYEIHILNDSKKCFPDINAGGVVGAQYVDGNENRNDQKKLDVKDKIYAPPNMEERSSPGIKVLYLAADPRKRLVKHIENSEFADLVKKKVDECGKTGDASKCIIEGMKLGASLVLDVAEESHAIQEIIDSRSQVSYEKYFNVRGNEIERQIRRLKPDIIQLACHCDGIKLIVCASGDTGYDSVKIEDFVRMLIGIEPTPKLLVLSCCNSDRFAKEILNRTEVELVAYARGSLRDAKTIQFSRVLYKNIFDGYSDEELCSPNSESSCGFEVECKGNVGDHKIYAYNKSGDSVATGACDQEYALDNHVQSNDAKKHDKSVSLYNRRPGARRKSYKEKIAEDALAYIDKMNGWQI